MLRGKRKKGNNQKSIKLGLLITQGGGGGLLSYTRLMGMCRWMGSHFQEWVYYNGVAFSIQLLECTLSDFFSKTVVHISMVSKRTRMFVLKMKSKVFFIQ